MIRIPIGNLPGPGPIATALATPYLNFAIPWLNDHPCGGEIAPDRFANPPTLA